jgi:hypothetical protein
VREEGWERPDAAHLVAATVLARQLAEAAIPLDDVQAQLEFLEDKRCDGLDINPHGTREGRREHKEMKLSEILPFLQWIEGQEELKAPLTALRAKTFLRGQNFYEPDEKEVGDHFFMRIENFACRMAVHKYALSNRDLATIRNVVKTANHMYVENQADHYDSKNMIDQIKLYRAAQFIDDIDYDFAGAI